MLVGKQVFVGSSSEQKNRAKKIVVELEKLNLSVLPWWDDKAFQPGQYTLSRLIQLSRICEASVFLFAGDDETWFRPSINPAPFLTARDNVLLEYGLFVGYGGTDRSLIVARSGVKLPSDLKGLNVLFYDESDSQISTAKAVRRYFERLLEKEAGRAGFQDSNFAIRTDWSLDIHRLDTTPSAKWSSTKLYEGRTGAAAWHKVETDPAYLQRTQTSISGPRLAELIGARPVHSVVSFGPGMGTVDTDLIGNLNSDSIREYLPIDINTHFLIESARRVSGQNPQVECKNAIQCDFDENINLVESLVADHCTGPRLFLMHGGTFGNLHRSENASLNSFYRMMEKGDIFTFDLYCKGPNYDPALDPMVDIGQWPTPVSKFFLNGIRRLEGRFDMEEQEALQRLEPTTSTASSALADTHTVQIVDKDTSKTIIQIKRFHFPAILDAIKQAGFSIVEHAKVTVGPLERHVLLAGK